MKLKINYALENDQVIDISTIGRKTGTFHRLEIWFHNIDGAFYITGQPIKKRDWFANIVATPEFTFHLMKSAQADIPASAKPIKDYKTRREILSKILKNSVWENQIDKWIEHSPLVEVKLKTDI